MQPNASSQPDKAAQRTPVGTRFSRLGAPHHYMSSAIFTSSHSSSPPSEDINTPFDHARHSRPLLPKPLAGVFAGAARPLSAADFSPPDFFKSPSKDKGKGKQRAGPLVARDSNAFFEGGDAAAYAERGSAAGVHTSPASDPSPASHPSPASQGSIPSDTHRTGLAPQGTLDSLLNDAPDDFVVVSEGSTSEPETDTPRHTRSQDTPSHARHAFSHASSLASLPTASQESFSRTQESYGHAQGSQGSLYQSAYSSEPPAPNHTPKQQWIGLHDAPAPHYAAKGASSTVSPPGHREASGIDAGASNTESYPRFPCPPVSDAPTSSQLPTTISMPDIPVSIAPRDDNHTPEPESKKRGSHKRKTDKKSPRDQALAEARAAAFCANGYELPPLPDLPPMTYDPAQYYAGKPIEHRTPMDPDFVRYTEKPVWTYAAMLGQALNHTPGHTLLLAEIYKWIRTYYPYYDIITRLHDVGWENSIRHNLSISLALVQTGDSDESAARPGKGSLWRIKPGCEFWFTQGTYSPPGKDSKWSVKFPAIKRDRKRPSAKKPASVKTMRRGGRRADDDDSGVSETEDEGEANEATSDGAAGTASSTSVAASGGSGGNGRRPPSGPAEPTATTGSAVDSTPRARPAFRNQLATPRAVPSPHSAASSPVDLFSPGPGLTAAPGSIFPALPTLKGRGPQLDPDDAEESDDGLPIRKDQRHVPLFSDTTAPARTGPFAAAGGRANLLAEAYVPSTDGEPDFAGIELSAPLYPSHGDSTIDPPVTSPHRPYQMPPPSPPKPNSFDPDAAFAAIKFNLNSPVHNSSPGAYTRSPLCSLTSSPVRSATRSPVSALRSRRTLDDAGGSPLAKRQRRPAPSAEP